MKRRLIQRHKLFLVVLCGTRALWGDACSGLLGGPPNAGKYWPTPGTDGQAPGVFRLQPKPGGPAFRVTVTTIATPPYDAPVHAGDIEVARCRDGKRLQQFPLIADQPINFGLSFEAGDINFDGYLDFSVLIEFAGSYTARAYWVYDPTSQRFVKNELTHTLEDTWKGYVISFDEKNHLIRAGILANGNACSGGMPDVYTVKNNRVILVHKVEITRYAPERCTVKVWDLTGGVLHVTSETRVDREGNPVGPGDVPPTEVTREVTRRAVNLLPATEPPPAPGVLLFEHPLDSAQEGLFSTWHERAQVGADQFVIASGATITGLRWYGYRTCLRDPGGSQAFEIAFFADQDGLARSEPFATAQVQAHIDPTAFIVINSYQVFLYSANLARPITVPSGQRTWLMIRQGFAYCEFLWNRSTVNDSETAAWGTADVADPTHYSEWHLLRPRAHFAFSLYGAVEPGKTQ
jgi:hypothetical protein